MTLTVSRRRERAAMLLSTVGGAVLILAVDAAVAHAQASPWESSAQKLATAFTGPIAKSLAAVAVVVSGLVFAYGEGQGKRLLAGVVFGLGMALGAVNFVSWLFPG